MNSLVSVWLLFIGQSMGTLTRTEFGDSETDLAIPIHYGFRFGSLTTNAMIYRDPFSPIDAEVELRFENDRSQSPNGNTIMDHVDFVLAGSLGSVSDIRSLIIRLPREAFVATRRFHRATILDISGGSIFARTVGSFLLVPPREGEYHGKIVLRPHDVRQYCFYGEMSFATYTQSTQFFVRVSWRHSEGSMMIGDRDMLVGDESVPFSFTPDRVSDLIPESAFNTFVNVLLPNVLGSENRFQVSMGMAESATVVWFDCGTDRTVIDRLPTLLYEIFQSADHSEPTTLLQLFPEDYVSINDGRCHVRFSPSGGAHGSFGLPTLSKTVIYIDSVRNIVGFGEPI